MKYSKTKKRDAFTLLEILVALSIVVLILSAVYGSYKATTSSISNYRPRSILEQKARLFLCEFAGELRCSYGENSNQYDQSAFQNVSGIKPQNNAFKLESRALFTGEKVSAGKVFLQFVTTSFASRLNQNTGGLAIVSYKLDDSGKVLLRNTRRYTEFAAKNEGNLQWFVILPDVKSISCEYLKAEKWQNEWNSKEMKSLPKAVKISLVVETKRTGALFFDTCAYIVCSEPEISESVTEKITAAYDFR